MTVDYPPAALYGLAVVGRAYRAIDPTFTDGRRLTVAIKASILLADAAVCAGLWIQIRRRYSEDAGRAAAFCSSSVPERLWTAPFLAIWIPGPDASRWERYWRWMAPRSPGAERRSPWPC